MAPVLSTGQGAVLTCEAPATQGASRLGRPSSVRGEWPARGRERPGLLLVARRLSALRREAPAGDSRNFRWQTSEALTLAIATAALMLAPMLALPLAQTPSRAAHPPRVPLRQSQPPHRWSSVLNGTVSAERAWAGMPTQPPRAQAQRRCEPTPPRQTVASGEYRCASCHDQRWMPEDGSPLPAGSPRRFHGSLLVLRPDRRPTLARTRRRRHPIDRARSSARAEAATSNLPSAFRACQESHAGRPTSASMQMTTSLSELIPLEMSPLECRLVDEVTWQSSLAWTVKRSRNRMSAYH